MHRLEIMAERSRRLEIMASVVALYLVACVLHHERAPVTLSTLYKRGDQISFFLPALYSRANALPIKQPSIPVVCQ